MFKCIIKLMALGKNEAPPGRIRLNNDGFDLYVEDTLKWQVHWDALNKIEVFKVDLITYDIVCMELFDFERDMTFPVNEEVKGFWEMVKRLKEALPSSLQDWDVDLENPTFARTRTTIYKS